MAPQRSPFATIAVIGAGLIGGSFAAASRGVAGVSRVIVHDRDPEPARLAVARGIADVAADTVARAVSDADLILLAVPVGSIPDVARACVASVPEGATITDVGSVKSRPVREVEGLVAASGRDVAFIGGHPMAGSEQSGIDGADPTLFQGAVWLLTPTAASGTAAVAALGEHLRALGARVLTVAPDVHDRLVAIASHLPQVIASTLADEAQSAASATGEAVLTVAAGGFRDVTRVAASDPELWTGILSENREALLTALARFSERLASFQRAIEERRWSEVRRRLEDGRRARSRMPGKERTGPLVDLVVPMDDRPGMLAAVTTALGNAGVNIEDLAMRHASAGDRGALMVAVAGHEVAERAQGLLMEAGYTSHLEPR